MALRFKKSGKAVKKGEITVKMGEKILEVQLRHGDVATMCDTRLQALTDVSCSSYRTQTEEFPLTAIQAYRHTERCPSLCHDQPND